MSGASPIVRTRKSVLTLGQPGDDLDWYARAVADLRQRPIADPTSWRYQGAVHGYPGTKNDPFATPGEALPSRSDQERFWNQCQHQTWYFLPWHRGYLACFEEIIAAAVVRLGGPQGWALPYWNYSAADASARSLPAAFLNQTNTDGSANALWVDGRNLTGVEDAIPVSDVSLEALLHSPFTGSALGGDPGFGGPQTSFSHFGGVNGRLENLPHNVIHVDVGGLMSDPDTAALDPIFWLHHANIDRLWEVWLHRNSSFVDPTSAAWLTGVTFDLHDAAGGVVTFTPSDMRDTTKVRHGYGYDDISDPVGGNRMLAAHVETVAAMTATPPQHPQLVGTSDTMVSLARAATSVKVAFNQPARQAAIARLAAARPVRAFLNLENITGTGQYGNYEVYINVPNAATVEPLFAGHLSTFGVRKASRSDSPHGGSGITTVLEITPQIDQLHRERNWDGAHLDVRFVPVQGTSSDPSAMPGRATVRRQADVAGPASSTEGPNIGRISVYYS
jgi:tyrosinase